MLGCVPPDPRALAGAGGHGGAAQLPRPDPGDGQPAQQLVRQPALLALPAQPHGGGGAKPATRLLHRALPSRQGMGLEYR